MKVEKRERRGMAMPMSIGKELFCMEQSRQSIGTRKDLVLYRLETAKSDLNAARISWMQRNIKEQTTGHIMLFFMRVIMMTSILQAGRKQNDSLQWQTSESVL
jgi:hypothetical protein